MSDRFAVSPALTRRSLLRTVAGAGRAGRLAAGRLRPGRRTQGPDQAVGLPLVLRRLHEADQDGPRPVRRGLRQDGPEVDRAGRPRPVADAQEARPDLRDDSAATASPRGSIASRTTTSAWPRFARASTPPPRPASPTSSRFSGNREGMDDQEGLKNCVAGLKKIAGYAEQKKVTVCLEFLNSHDHKDYMADSTKWCVELVHRVGSPRVKVLYDIYHAAR